MAELTPAAPEDDVRTLAGAPARLARVLAVGLSLYALYWVVAIVEPRLYRASFLLLALVLAFLVAPPTRRSPRDGPGAAGLGAGRPLRASCWRGRSWTAPTSPTVP